MRRRTTLLSPGSRMSGFVGAIVPQRFFSLCFISMGSLVVLLTSLTSAGRSSALPRSRPAVDDTTLASDEGQRSEPAVLAQHTRLGSAAVWLEGKNPYWSDTADVTAATPLDAT